MTDSNSLKSIEDFITLVDSIVPQKSHKKISPHKYIFLLTLARMLDSSSQRFNRFPFDEELTNTFSQIWLKFYPDDDKPGLPEYPYYHLVSSPIWNHSIYKGKEEKYNNYKRFTPKRIRETIEYSFLHPVLFDLLKESSNRAKFVEKLEQKILEITTEKIPSNAPNVNHNTSKSKSSAEQHAKIIVAKEKPRQYQSIQAKKSRSKFPHEQHAIDKIRKPLSNKLEFIPNYDLYDPATNQYLECDLIAVSQDRLAIIELKHWTGEIEIQPNRWRISVSRYRKDPHASNVYKCKVLHGFYEKAFPTLPKLWVESIVVLTNPDAIVHNAHPYKTTLHNPSFAGVETLIRHLKYRLGSQSQRLTSHDVKRVAQKIREQWRVTPAKPLHIPGYETLENLTQTPQRIELLVRPSGNQLQTIKRLRIFLIDPDASEEAREIQRIKSLNSLKALERIGEHPNIIKVWSIPHEDGLIIEASDWSQEGTLADVMQKQQEFSWEDAIAIISGILRGLTAAHAECVIHRDLRPENILMVKGTPKLMNFDLSYMIEDNRVTVFPETDVSKASPYMAPELFTKEGLSEATDLFSVGVMFYELLTGVLPFKSAQELEKSNGELSDAALAKLKAREVPDDVQMIICSLLQRKLGARPQKAEDVLKKLQDIGMQPLPVAAVNRVLQPGEEYGVYRIEKLIGSGREAQVYEAKQTTERNVALKLFHAEIPRERIYAERNAMDSVQNPYVVRCEAPGQWSDKRFFLVLRLVQGKSLRQMIEEGELPDLKHFEHVTRCLLEALTVMHQAPDRQTALLHNDIKPGNIILRPEGDPVLLDFGTAGAPHVGAYMGTPAYTAPDLFQEIDFEFCESGDLFAFGVTLFEWFCGRRPYQTLPSLSLLPEAITDFRHDTPAKLSEWFAKAVQPCKEDRFGDVLRMREAFEEAYAPPKPQKSIEEIRLPSLASPQTSGENPFVTYLNTLHNTTAANPNALAESQALNPYFGSIHVPLPLTDFIAAQLTAPAGAHVILTGHAGDGKSTIALELYKRCQQLPIEIPLAQPLKEREQVSLGDGRTLHLIKDMSELRREIRREILQEAVHADKTGERWCIISNTGTLLETFKELAATERKDPAELEHRMLTLLEKNDPGRLNTFGNPFIVLNLTRVDNISTAVQLFNKFIADSHWQTCQKCDIRQSCPIYLNVRALQQQRTLSSERIEWIYRRLHEYGHRLTIRQMSAHLAYTLSSGLDCDDVRKLAAQAVPPDITHYLCFNRFFGFQGTIEDEEAQRLTAVKYLAPLEMGAKPYPTLERRFWMSEGGVFPDVPDVLRPIFEYLLQKNQELLSSVDASSARMRQQLRRLLYIFGRFPQDSESFVSDFLGSQMLREAESWQEAGTGPASLRKAQLKQQVLHVLQEQYIGVLLPEHSAAQELFITLKRGNDELRQSVQIILAKIPFSNFTLEMQPVTEVLKPQRYILTLVEKRARRSLPLELPFLDFVLLRSKGEIGKQLNMAYTDRLERFKAWLLDIPDYRLNDLELLELTVDGNLRTRRLEFNGDTLKVS